MKSKKLLKLMGGIDPKYIAEAEPKAETKARSRRNRFIGMGSAVAAVLAVVIIVGAFFRGNALPVAAGSFEPDYTRQYNGDEVDSSYLSAIRRFAADSAEHILEANVNTAYSPMALYTGISMLTELADDSLTDPMLDVLNVDSIETLRSQSGNLWRYLCNDPETKKPGVINVADSLWLNNKYVFNTDPLQNLADNYYVAVYQGDMKNDIPKRMSDWLKRQTHGLLDRKVETTPDLMAMLISTVYFYDDWAVKFSSYDISDGWFFTSDHDFDLPVTEQEYIECTYMSRQEDDCSYYKNNGVTAAVQYFKNGGKMLFILPEKGSDPSVVLSDTTLLCDLLDWENAQTSKGIVEWSIPRFKLSCNSDITQSLDLLGLGSLLDPTSDPLSKLSADGTPAYIGKVEQGTSISVNENGCEAASYVAFDMLAGSALDTREKIYMTLDRPFVFAILSKNDVPLFLGVVNDPNG